MIATRRNTCAAVAALATGTAILVFPAGPAAAATSVRPLPAPVSGEFSPATVSYDGRQVALDGRYPREGTSLLVDWTTGTQQEVVGDRNYDAISGLVPDNSDLFVSIEPTEVYSRAGAFLLDRRTGARVRIDTAADGTPLPAAWPGICDEECGQTDNPGILVGPESVSQDGRLVAFCANLGSPAVFDLYLKDMTTGALQVRPGLCAQGWPAGTLHLSMATEAPEVSSNASVIHVRGARNTEEGQFYPDSLLYPATGSVRTINGQGSMTRDGSTVFMRIGSYRFGEPDRTKGKVGAYNVKTGKIKKLPGKNEIYGSNALWEFSAQRRASLRGRFVAYGNKLRVLDRKSGRKYDIKRVLAKAGFPAPRASDWRPLLSLDGTTVITYSGAQYVAVKFR